MKIMKRMLLCAVFPALFGLWLSGCGSSAVPLTTSIISEVGGLENTPSFQYYVSKEITLTRVESSSSSTIEDGELRRRSQTSRNRVTISEGLPGLVRAFDRPKEDDPDWIELEVAFEKLEGDPVLFFGGSRTSDYFPLLYDDAENDIIRYGNEYYKVSYARRGIEPHLLIKGNERSRETGRARRARGLRLGD